MDKEKTPDATPLPLSKEALEEYNRELDEADAEIEAGEFLTHEEVVEESKLW